eukprot:1544364-Rhodomonas_salina.1
MPFACKVEKRLTSRVGCAGFGLGTRVWFGQGSDLARSVDAFRLRKLLPLARACQPHTLGQ